MKYIKKHKTTTMVVIIFIISVILLYFALDKFFIKSNFPKYGDRLEGIEEVTITDDDKKNMISSIKENSNVENVELDLSGRTLNVIITVKDDVSINDAKKIGDTVITKLSDKQIEYYSVQIFVKKNSEEQNNFPIIGYKQKGSKSISWTKNREVTKEDETK